MDVRPHPSRPISNTWLYGYLSTLVRMHTYSHSRVNSTSGEDVSFSTASMRLWMVCKLAYM